MEKLLQYMSIYFFYMSEFTVRIHNRNRMMKVDNSQTSKRNWSNRPRAYYKNLSYYQIPIVMNKLGYEYKTENKVLQDIQSGFRAKCEVYFNQPRRVKLGRMDKIKRKEELNFQMKPNPVLTLFNKLNRKLVMPNLSDAFERIAQY